MKRLLSALLVFLASCTHPQTLPKIGDRFSTPDSSELLLINSAQFAPYRKIEVDGVKFDIAALDNKVVYISTSDPKFKTPEGLTTLSTLKDVLDAGGAQPWNERGFAFHAMLPSGWCADFSILEPGGSASGLPLQWRSKVLLSTRVGSFSKPK